MQLLARHVQGCFESDETGVLRVTAECPSLLWIVGSALDSTFVVDAAFDVSDLTSTTETTSWRSRLEAGLPEGSSILGCFCRRSQEDDSDSAPTLPKQLKCQTDPLLVFGEASNGNFCAWRFTNLAEALTPWRVDATAAPMLRAVARGRLVAGVPLLRPTEIASELERQAAGFQDSLCFLFPGSNMALKIKDLEKEKVRLPASSAARGVVTVDVLSESLSVIACKGPANFIDQTASVATEYSFDFLACIDPNAEGLEIAKALLASLQRQVATTVAIVRSSGSAVAPVNFRSFRPEPLNGNLTIALAETETTEVRCNLHKLLRLPEVPLLRPECALPWGSILHPCATGKPVNPHLDCGQKPGWWKGGEETKTAFIRGMYEYCHYMQDQFDDNGWGCAYRSLQTCVSWYRMQFYSAKGVPGIVEIQELLKRIDEAHKDIKVGGKRWIGTVEGMHVLQDYLGVECRLEFCQDVDDMANKVPSFLQHFAIQGTPIMMGVGQKAFTMVGLCYDSASGEVGFLIVDPHYTGSDELKKILDKGWVGWKKLDFFRKEADGFINCCLPQVPQAI